MTDPEPLDLELLQSAAEHEREQGRVAQALLLQRAALEIAALRNEENRLRCLALFAAVSVVRFIEGHIDQDGLQREMQKFHERLTTEGRGRGFFSEP